MRSTLMILSGTTVPFFCGALTVNPWGIAVGVAVGAALIVGGMLSST